MRTSATATAPDGTLWHINIRWMPRWRALARRFGGWRDGRDGGRRLGDAADWTPDFSSWPDVDCGTARGSGGWFDVDFGDDLLGALAAIVMLVVAGVLFWWVLLPVLLLVLDVAIVILLFVAGTLGRVLLHRPWVLDATDQSGHRFTRQVVGWRHAQSEVTDMAAQIRAGTATVLDLAGLGTSTRPSP